MDAWEEDAAQTFQAMFADYSKYYSLQTTEGEFRNRGIDYVEKVGAFPRSTNSPGGTHVESP